MKIFPSNDGKAAFVRLLPGTDLLKGLNDAVAELGIQAGTLQIVGAVRNLVVAYFDQQTKKYRDFQRYDEPMEIAGGVGNISLKDGAPSIVSVFAGRIADTGRDPIPMMAEALAILTDYPSAELLWASPRELLNIVQADRIGCHIITATSDILAKLATLGKDLDEFSLDTVKMFYEDARAAGYSL